METECTAEKASPLCGFVALLLTLGTTSLMNGSLFPQFDAIFMFARDISVTFSAATLLGLGLAAYRAPRLLRERAIIAVAVALVSGSSAVSAIAGLLLGGAAVENLLYSALGLLTGRPDEVRQVFDGYLAVTVSQLGYGNVLPWDAMLPVLATIAVVAAAGMMIMRRRRLA